MTNTVATLSGLFKETYANRIEDLIPEGVKFMKMVKFIESSKENGNFYHQPVLLSHEQGVTYAGPSAGAFTLEAAVASVMQDAQIAGSQLLLRSAMSYEAAARASNSQKAFVKATQLIVENMLKSISKRLEIALLYGRSGLAKAASSANVDATTTDVTIQTASWASGIWSGIEQSLLVAYNGTTVVSGTSASFTVSRVNLTSRVVRLTGQAADITALDAAILANPNVIDFYFKSAVSGTGGSFAFAEFAGLDAIITNNSTLFNINAAQYALWKGNVHSASSAALSMTKILAGIALAVERGLDEDVQVLLSPKTWANLAADQAALRKYDSSYKPSKAENGHESIVYYGQNGMVEIVSSIFVKEGEAFIFPPKRLKRIGAMEVGFKLPGRQEQESFFLELANGAGYELRCYTDQALFCDSPAKLVKINNIVNS